MRRVGMAIMVLLLAGAAAACGGPADAARLADSAAAPTVTPTGNVIEVKMVSGGAGELFTPADIVAQRGDVIRFVLEAGVHNVSFPAASNPSGISLPKASAYLQVPGQTYDLLVDMPAGVYNYHCDPHAVLGMVGTLTVQD
jgi:plastocyanin